MYKVGDKIVVERAETNSGIEVKCNAKGIIRRVYREGLYSVELEVDGYWCDEPGKKIRVKEKNINRRETNLNNLLDV